MVVLLEIPRAKQQKYRRRKKENEGFNDTRTQWFHFKQKMLPGDSKTSRGES